MRNGMSDVRGRAKAEKNFFRRRDVRVIRAKLEGSDTCSALGFTVRSPSPVLALCRKLVEAGHDPDIPLEAYRGGTLALRVKSIGRAAGLEVNSACTGFSPRAEPRRGGPMRYFREAAE
jgi:hypothetical protein